MCISDIDVKRKQAKKTALVYLGVTLFCVIFGMVYEVFSHGVYSAYMIFAFAVPLIGGVIPYFLLLKLCPDRYPANKAASIYNSGVATLTVGSVMKGVLDIYGTTNRLFIVYPIAGTALIAAGILLWAVHIAKRAE